jgi:pyrroloquinoline quinone biosynthesis protein B
MIVKVLGSAAGGGFPQWNCNCPNCRDVRLGSVDLRVRTQSSLAVSADGKTWILLNASPDLRQQILATPELMPSAGQLRGSPISAVVVTNGDVDHIAGLICLREGHHFQLYATARVLTALAANPVFDVLNREKVPRQTLPLDQPIPVGGPARLTVEAFTVPGKIALYLENAAAGPGFGTADGDTIGLSISDGQSRFFYIPGCARLDAQLAQRLTGAALLFFDGTLYDDDEMIRLGLSEKTGARMGHMSMAGAQGSLAAFANTDIARKIFVHMNNSNPALRETSDEHAAVRAAGWEIAWDGMEVRL